MSEACRRYSRASAWSSLRAQTLPDLWDDPQRRQEAYRYVNALYERTLPDLGERLNAIHGEHHAERYWRLLIGVWLFNYLSALFDRYSHLVLALERFPALTTVLLANECDVVPRDTHDFMERGRTDSYNLQLYSRILECVGKVDFPRVAMPQAVDPVVPWGRQWKGAARMLRPFARRVLSGLLAHAGGERVILHQSYFSREVELQLATKSKGSVMPSFILDAPVAAEKPDAAVRATLAGLPSVPRERFEDVLAELLPRDIPYCFVENYQDVKRRARRFPVGPRAIFSANSWIYHETFKQWAGRCSEEGTLLLVSQHGGGYFGIGTYFPQEDHELRIADRYYTWGWRPPGPDQDKTVPMPATLLAGRRPVPPDNRRTGILYLATAEPRYMQTFQDPVGYFARYLEWQKRFLDAVPASTKQLLRARLFMEDMGWDMRDRWRDHAPQVPIEHPSRPFLESLEDCRLFVSDHLGTTVVEALAANKPSIMFFNPESNPFRREAQPLFEELLASGILHATPEGAALAVATVYPDIETWWNEPGRQAARLNFCARHGRTSQDAVADWTDEFRRLSKSVPAGSEPRPGASARE